MPGHPKVGKSGYTTECKWEHLDGMKAEEAFVEEFLDACAAGDLSNTQEAISSGRLTVEDLDEGLKLATEEARPEIVTALFDAGARATSAISWLTGEQRELPGIIRQFFDHGLDPNATSNGEPLLCLLSTPESAREFLLRGADPNRCSPRGASPLMRAISSTCEEDPSLFELLLAHGAKLEPHLLFKAIAPRLRQGEFMTKYLLAKGLDINMTHEIWGSPLHRAITYSKLSIIKLLVDAGADRTARPAGTPYHDESPLEFAERSERSDKEAILSLLRS
ncbi:hypothetical protein PEX2_005120 [Penicillium expansum]|uniref:Uncharacterized protein n=1 Tax=Penicillium expansum TaxID=27334 RepID=A0A0A2JK26_PENEN|nr:hypothetical protein PEX2_005120 [Penicillium expansum]KGO55752.1 hypothetical protein PEX2_005120 [Penicillium expansum]